MSSANRIISAVLSVLLCISTVFILSVSLSPEEKGVMNFIDVPEGKWYYGNVKYVFENGFMLITALLLVYN